MTRALMELAGGQVILTLEGGYDKESLALSATACLTALLGHEMGAISSSNRSALDRGIGTPLPTAMAVCRFGCVCVCVFLF